MITLYPAFSRIGFNLKATSRFMFFLQHALTRESRAIKASVTRIDDNGGKTGLGERSGGERHGCQTANKRIAENVPT
jgi:hypothetical protein